MAYVILSKESNSLCKIAANDTDLNNLNIVQNDYKVISISDSDWNLLQKDLLVVESSTEDSVTFQAITKDTTNGVFTEESLKQDISNWIKQINLFLKNNQSHPDKTEWESFKSYMESFDYSQITFPMHQTFYEFCADQPGLQWRNLLQLP